MNLQVSPKGDGVAATLDDLAPAETHALRLLRMWSWGVIHRETLRLAAATQFGQTHGLCVVGAFESLFALMETCVTPKLSVRPPDSTKLNDDERWFLHLVAAAPGGPDAVALSAAGRARAGTELRLAESLHGFTRILADCLARKARPAHAACPVSCPMQTECTERTDGQPGERPSQRPNLEVVK